MTHLPEGKSSGSSLTAQEMSILGSQRKRKAAISCVCQFSQNNAPIVVNAKLTI